MSTHSQPPRWERAEVRSKRLENGIKVYQIGVYDKSVLNVRLDRDAFSLAGEYWSDRFKKGKLGSRGWSTSHTHGGLKLHVCTEVTQRTVRFKFRLSRPPLDVRNLGRSRVSGSRWYRYDGETGLMVSA